LKSIASFGEEIRHIWQLSHLNAPRNPETQARSEREQNKAALLKGSRAGRASCLSRGEHQSKLKPVFIGRYTFKAANYGRSSGASSASFVADINSSAESRETRRFPLP
jgi:hypothetical protein